MPTIEAPADVTIRQDPVEQQIRQDEGAVVTEYIYESVRWADEVALLVAPHRDRSGADAALARVRARLDRADAAELLAEGYADTATEDLEMAEQDLRGTLDCLPDA